MMLMVEGIEKKKGALIMLNNAYVNTRRSWNLRHTFNKVQNHLLDIKKYQPNNTTKYLSKTLKSRVVEDKALYDDHLEAIYLHGMIYLSRGPHQYGIQLLDAYFGWAIPVDGEYTGVVDSAKEMLRAVDVVHRLTTNNITFQCEDPRHFVKGAFEIGHEEDEDRQRYCTVCRWAF
uniref:Uncharacterized protein n=1 Tax=Lactuca sativa TaxID=4236 RepID=A0A9R1X0J8_LACSA|nr:hypothetical protein LSAT_V11C800411030 [Lactuca sativa]